MDGTLAPDRSQHRVLHATLGAVALGAIVYMASKTDLLNSVAQWVFDDTDTGNCDFDEYGKMRERILDIDEDIEVLKNQLTHTGYAPDRARILRNIATLESEKTILENKYGHCSGWGNH